MDLSSKDFSLNFRGFEQDDPETVKRFTAFCEANFDVPPNIFNLTKEHPLTVVLAQGESSEELEALANELRGIGARVDVSEKCRIVEGETLDAIPTQELHRLFGHHQESSQDEASGPSCVYSPIGRTLYLLTQSDGVFDRRRLRPSNYRRDARKETAPSPPNPTNSLFAFSIVSLCVGVIILIAVALIFKGTRATQTREPGSRSPFQPRAYSDAPKSDGAIHYETSAKTLSVTTRLSGFDVSMKVLTSATALSISTLILVPQSEAGIRHGAVIKKVMGDPTFLSQSSPGEWTGPILLSVFVDADGHESHFTIPAQITVNVNIDHTAGRAFIEVKDSKALGSSSVTTEWHAEVADRLRALAAQDISLS